MTHFVAFTLGENTGAILRVHMSNYRIVGFFEENEKWLIDVLEQGSTFTFILPVGPVRIACFVLGVVSLCVCLSSAVDAYAMSLFWMHMIEHLTLIMLVPALLVLGHPLTVLRASGGERWQAGFDRFMYSLPVAIVTHPFVGMAVYADQSVFVQIAS